jgi:alpha-aminoadipic semialdehyde synthase
MSVDILPAELPLESSTYFGDKLLPFLKKMAAGAYDDPALKRATIASNGKLEQKHAWLQSKLPCANPIGPKTKNRKRVVILGSGYVAGPLIDYIARDPLVDITIGMSHFYVECNFQH